VEGAQLRASAKVVTFCADGETKTDGGLDACRDKGDDADAGTSDTDTAETTTLLPSKK